MKNYFLIIFVAFICNIKTSTAQVAGRLDSTFGTNGYTLHMFPNHAGSYVNSEIFKLRQKHTGQLVSTAYLMDIPAGQLVQYSSNGIPDTFCLPTELDNFYSFYSSAGFGYNDILIDSLDNIITAVGAGPGIPIILKFKNDGSVDTSFGQNHDAVCNGYTKIDSPIISGFSSSYLTHLAFQPDGKILSSFTAADFSLPQHVKEKIGIIRYFSNGYVDSSFNPRTSPLAVLPDTMGNYPAIKALKVQSDNKIVFCYNFTLLSGFGIGRYLPDGRLDSTFGINGYNWITDNGLRANGQPFGPSDLIIRPDGKILVGGSFADTSMHYRFFTALIKSNGQRDSSYGNNGIITYTINDSVNAAKMIQQPDGKIIFAGSTGSYDPMGAWDGWAPKKFALARFNANGSPDLSFGNSGLTLEDFNNSMVRCEDAVLQPDGKIVLMGWGLTSTFLATYLTPLIARFIGSTSLGLDNNLIDQNEIYTYPNPCKGSFQFNGLDTKTSYSVEIYDITGRLVYQNESFESNISVICKDWNSGNYYAKIRGGSGQINHVKICVIR
jgi:uncharacterized delta-60 repeat protein